MLSLQNILYVEKFAFVQHQLILVLQKVKNQLLICLFASVVSFCGDFKILV